MCERDKGMDVWDAEKVCECITYMLSYDIIVKYNTEMFFIQSAFNLQREKEKKE